MQYYRNYLCIRVNRSIERGMQALHRLGSITDVTADMAGGVAVCGSHGGRYPATLASRAGLRAVIFNDAGIGYEEAGVAGVMALGATGMAAAAADCMTCRIGSAEDMLESGVISTANAPARSLGVEPGLPVAEAARLLASAEQPHSRLDPIAESRFEHRLDGVAVLCVDSASLVTPDDRDRLIVTGSHGGLIGGDPARALKARARLAVFNDAGIGKDEAGTTRLPALDRVGIAAVTISHLSARIGDAQSALRTGRMSRGNRAASRLGLRAGTVLKAALSAEPFIS